MKRITLFSHREKISLLILIITIIAALTFIFWKSNLQPHSSIQIKGWVAYSDQSIPFVFDHPSSWSVDRKTTPRSTILTVSNTEKRPAASIAYSPYVNDGIAEGVAACQVHTTEPRPGCSYIDNSVVGEFYHAENTAYWSGTIDKTRAKIGLKLILEDKTTEELLIKMAKSVRWE